MLMVPTAKDYISSCVEWCVRACVCVCVGACVHMPTLYNITPFCTKLMCPQNFHLIGYSVEAFSFTLFSPADYY